MKHKDESTSIDPLTGEVFIKKRSNQIFANSENQIRYNNLKAYEKRKAKAQFDRILDRSRQVLKLTLGTYEEIIKTRDYLEGAGLNFGCNTHTIIRDGIKWICIYDYAYSPIGSNTFKIIKLNK
ncbi:hypothetical protein SAMN04515667_1694 [Formosa sp. Hel1_31_208]|uniref:hypothetical protein n=1 Tax=Formosa sp. Hel1_31_208 TaxID=1798225 RepID=UPI00087AD4E3|nr:hypothetical protein [Formosa sp. Hel1_31_208]SDS22557.1 hypothetical protein SAMN04515667_1694 [Formosa sp. Hel1_31_208]